MRRRWLYLILGFSFLFVMMPFLFWQATWFGRPLDDAQMERNLADQDHPRKVQHALSQIADRILSRDPAVRASVRRWYPAVVSFSNARNDDLRTTAAWVMGQDNTVPEFRQALLHMLTDAHPMVRRNAALSLVRFGDAAGRPVILAMLEPYTVRAPRPGALAQRLKIGEVINPGTLLGRIQDGSQTVELRAEVPGTLERWVARDATLVSREEALLLLAPSPEIVWEALRGLYLVGQPEDLPVIERYARGVAGMPERVGLQAQATAGAIRSRSVN